MLILSSSVDSSMLAPSQRPLGTLFFNIVPPTLQSIPQHLYFLNTPPR